MPSTPHSRQGNQNSMGKSGGAGSGGHGSRAAARHSSSAAGAGANNGAAAAAAAAAAGRGHGDGNSKGTAVNAASIQDLPVYKVRKKFLKLFKQHRVLVCAGATGSGKSTQLPKFLMEAGLLGGGGRMVGITQPRRVAAVTVARRVAAELGTPLGDTVGYAVRFDRRVSAATRIKYMTDGILLREAMADPELKRYSVVIIDEAHERTLHSDILFGILKGLLARRGGGGGGGGDSGGGEVGGEVTGKEGTRKKTKNNGLKVIIMSATLEMDMFLRYFPGAGKLNVPGRQHPVQIFYPFEPVQDYVEAALTTAVQIHLDEPAGGDVLVFLTGQEEIEGAEAQLAKRARLLPAAAGKLLVCPIFSALEPAKQYEVFAAAPPDTRKVILATNIAESSITIPGVKYVVDTGLAKMRGYKATSGMECLVVTQISKQQAQQRSGRAGRESAGKCFRLYREVAFKDLRDAALPEICRSNLANVILQLKVIGVADPMAFDFIQPPSVAAMRAAMQQLLLLGGLRPSDGQLTDFGRRMATLPLEPMYAKLLLDAERFSCVAEILSLVAMLSVDSIFYVPPGKQDKADAARRRLQAYYGDHETLINIYHRFVDMRQDTAWCKEHFVNKRSMIKATKIRAQLEELCTKLKIDSTSKPLDTGEEVRQCLTSACYLNAAQIQVSVDGLDGGSNRKHKRSVARRKYKTLTAGQEVSIHPSSILFGRKPQPESVVYSEMVMTSRPYIRCVTVIETKWLAEMVPEFARRGGGGVEREDVVPTKRSRLGSGGGRGGGGGARSGW